MTSGQRRPKGRLLDDLFALVSLPAALVGPTGRIENHNAQFAANLGLPVEGAVGHDFRTLLSPQGAIAFDHLLNSGPEPNAGHARVSMPLLGVAGGSAGADVTPLEGEGGISGFLIELPKATDQEDLRMQYVLERIDLGVWDFDTSKACFTVSDAWCEMRGLGSAAQIDMPSDVWLENVHPEDRNLLRDLFHGRVAGGQKNTVIQYRHRHTSGHWVWILCRASVMGVDEMGKPLKIVGTDTDITDMKQREGELLELTSKLQMAIEASGMGIWEFDPTTSLVHWDDKMLEIYDISDGRNIRSDDIWETFIHPDDRADTIAYADQCQRNQADFKRDYRIVRPNGRVRHIRSLARSVAAPGSDRKLIGVNIDITEDYYRTQELERARRQLEHDSRHDSLTDLGNRRKADEKILALFKTISHDHRYAVMQIDLDHFKSVNDSLGHAAGDYVLTIVARKLQEVIDAGGNVFRIGGDEFMILFEAAPAEESIMDLCETLIERISEKTTFQDRDCTIGASIGYAIGKGPPINPNEIFMAADAALYAAKHAGRSCFRAYSKELEAQLGNVGSVRQDLIDAMDNGEFTCHFQPQFDAQTLEIVGAEALIRWQCPTRGLLTPDKFLPQAIRAGLLPDVDAYVFELVTRKQNEWAEENIEFPPISVNISKERLDSLDLVEQVRDALEPHHLLKFELLETAFLDHREIHLAFRLDALRDLGIRIELDSFGSGHSSVTALQAVQPDSVKIDRSLIEAIKSKPNQLMTLRALSRIARAENANVIVEGLETGLQLATIRDLDCDALQGYALQRPMPEMEFLALLARDSTTSQTKAG